LRGLSPLVILHAMSRAVTILYPAALPCLRACLSIISESAKKRENRDRRKAPGANARFGPSPETPKVKKPELKSVWVLNPYKSVRNQSRTRVDPQYSTDMKSGKSPW